MQEPSNDLIINQSFGSSHCKLDNSTDHLPQGKKKLQNDALYQSYKVYLIYIIERSPTKQSNLDS